MFWNIESQFHNASVVERTALLDHRSYKNKREIHYPDGNLFLYKKNVKKIIIPDKIKSYGKTFKITGIGKKAFYKCKKLKKITIKASGIKNVAKNAFKGTSEKLKIYVPGEKRKAYIKIFNKVHLSYR